jgi:ParB family transcriptional regulator, chromosome partitioning protein
VAQKPVLGKGLASLFPGMQSMTPMATPSPGNPAETQNQTGGAVSAGPAQPVTAHSAVSADLGNRDRHPGISMAIVDEILVNPYQPRREFDEQALVELSQSIKTSGIIQPLVVRKDAAGHYQLIAGERRLRAAKMAGLKQVPIVIRRSTDREALELALIENIQRQNLNCIDEALAYFQLMQDFSLTQEEVAQRVGKERATVANFLRLLRLPEAIIDDLKRQILTFGHGKVLLGLEDSETRLRARAEIVEKHLSVRDAEALVERLKQSAINPTADASATPAPPKSPLVARMQSLAQELTRHWSAKVELKGTERRGKIMIHYGSRQELDRLLEAMHNR